ncbi:MAG: hypothetical protein ISQ06_04680 [Planctomycetaceae bacterium]|nr:hypothetical protein [Planctomycetaceae bacterium]
MKRKLAQTRLLKCLAGHIAGTIGQNYHSRLPAAWMSRLEVTSLIVCGQKPDFE